MARVGKRKAVGENAKEIVTGRKVVDAHSELLLRCGAASIKMSPDGIIEICGIELRADAATLIKMISARIDLN